MQFVFSSGLEQESERRVCKEGWVIRPLQVEECILEAVGRHLAWADWFACLDQVPGPQVCEHLHQRHVLVGNDQLVHVDQHEVLETVHVPVQTVIQRCKQALRSDFFLGVHVKLPGENFHNTLLDVVRQHAVHLFAHGVIVQGEPGGGEVYCLEILDIFIYGS